MKKNIFYLFIFLQLFILGPGYTQEFSPEPTPPMTLIIKSSGNSCLSALQQALIHSIEQITDTENISNKVALLLRTEILNIHDEALLRSQIAEITRGLILQFSIQEIKDLTNEVHLTIQIIRGTYAPLPQRTLQATIGCLPFAFSSRFNKKRDQTLSQLQILCKEDFLSFFCDSLHKTNIGFIISPSELEAILPKNLKTPLSIKQIKTLKEIGKQQQVHYWIFGEIEQVDYKERIIFNRESNDFYTLRVLKITCCFQILNNFRETTKLNVKKFTYTFPEEQLNTLISHQQFNLIAPLLIKQSTQYFSQQVIQTLP